MPCVDLNTVSRESLAGAKLSRQVSQGFPKIVPEFYSLKGYSRSGMAVTTDARDIIQLFDQMNNKGGKNEPKVVSFGFIALCLHISALDRHDRD